MIWSWPRSSACFPFCTVPIAEAICCARFSSANSFSIAFCDSASACFFSSLPSPTVEPSASALLVRERGLQLRQDPVRDPLVPRPFDQRLHVPLDGDPPPQHRLHRVQLPPQQ